MIDPLNTWIYSGLELRRQDYLNLKSGEKFYP